MSQANLFPVKLFHEESTSGTKDLKLIGYTAARVKYAVKRESDGALLPLAEWIGHHLSRLCDIATPDFDIVECLNGELAFGSRWDDNVTQITPGMAQADALLLLQTHASAISPIFGLDFFLPNPDRHAGNFLFVRRAGVQVCLSMDFSLSSVRNAIPFGELPMYPECNTNILLRDIFIKHFNNFDKRAFNKSLDTIRSISIDQISTILNGAPDAWFSLVTRRQIIDWWDTSSGARIAQVHR